MQIPFRICGWHEPRQPVLPGFSATHGICPVCLEKQLLQLPMAKHAIPDWVKMINEGGWTTATSGGYWPNLVRRVGLNDNFGQCVFHVDATKHSAPTWACEHDGVVIAYGDLTEVLEAADEVMLKLL